MRSRPAGGAERQEGYGDDSRPAAVGTRLIRYPIREPNHGEVVAVHVREDGPAGKRMWWEQPDGTPGLGGLRTEDLPLYGAAAVRRWEMERPVIVCEGEKATSALVHAGWQAVGTVTGASGCPAREPLTVLAGNHLLLWADNDAPGSMHMLRVAAALGQPGEIAASIGMIVWADAPPGGDAADAVAAGVDIGRLVAEAGPVISDPPDDDPPAPAPRPLRLPRYAEPAGSPIERFNAAVTVTDVLSREFGIEARPGRTVRCPAHDDRSPSLSVLSDDRRVLCHAPGCALNDNGRGADAWALAHVARTVLA